MSYTVKLAIFPPWKAPVPYETLGGVFPTAAEAANPSYSLGRGEDGGERSLTR